MDGAKERITERELFKTRIKVVLLLVMRHLPNNSGTNYSKCVYGIWIIVIIIFVFNQKCIHIINIIK